MRALTNRIDIFERCPPPLAARTHPLCVWSSSVLWQIHGVNENPQWTGDVRLSAGELDQQHGVLQFFGRVIAVEMELNARPVTEHHQRHSRLLSPDFQHPDNVPDEVQDLRKSAYKIKFLFIKTRVNVWKTDISPCTCQPRTFPPSEICPARTFPPVSQKEMRKLPG